MAQVNPHSDELQQNPAQGSERLPAWLENPVFICNPTAGGGRTRRRWALFEEHLRAQGLRHSMHWTEGPGHAETFAQEAVQNGATLVVAVGGDGTLHEVVNGLLRMEGAVPPIAVLPCGTGNDFARANGVPGQPQSFLTSLRNGRPTPLDVGVVNDRYFVNVAGCGFDAEVARAVNLGGKRRSGTWPYLAAVLKLLASYREPDVDVRWSSIGDSRTENWRGPLFLLAVGNGPAYAGGMKICPDARLDDGILDVCLGTNVTKGELLGLLPRIYRGAHRGHPKVRLWKTTELAIEGPLGTPVHADGEYIGDLPAVFHVKRHALTVILPQFAKH